MAVGSGCAGELGSWELAKRGWFTGALDVAYRLQALEENQNELAQALCPGGAPATFGHLPSVSRTFLGLGI